MSTPRKNKSSRVGPQQTNKYFHVLAPPLRLAKRTDPAAQEDHSSGTHPGNADGRRSSDRDAFDLYDRWLALSPREQQVTYLACQGCKNDQIAFRMGITAGTVKSYLEHVYNKIDVRSKADLRLKFVNFDFTGNPP